MFTFSVYRNNSTETCIVVDIINIGLYLPSYLLSFFPSAFLLASLAGDSGSSWRRSLLAAACVRTVPRGLQSGGGSSGGSGGSGSGRSSNNGSDIGAILALHMRGRMQQDALHRGGGDGAGKGTGKGAAKGGDGRGLEGGGVVSWAREVEELASWLQWYAVRGSVTGIFAENTPIREDDARAALGDVLCSAMAQVVQMLPSILAVVQPPTPVTRSSQGGPQGGGGGGKPIYMVSLWRNVMGLVVQATHCALGQGWGGRGSGGGGAEGAGGASRARLGRWRLSLRAVARLLEATERVVQWSRGEPSCGERSPMRSQAPLQR